MIYELVAFNTETYTDIRYRDYTTSKRKAERFNKIPKIQFTDSGHGIVFSASEHKGKKLPVLKYDLGLYVDRYLKENQMNTDISLRNTFEKDARTLEKTAAYLREFANTENSENYREELRTLRAHIKCAMEVLLHHLPT